MTNHNRVMEGVSRCNFCALKMFENAAEALGQQIEFVSQSVYEADEQSSETVYSASGVAVLMNGARVAWFASRPNYCVCT